MTAITEWWVTTEDLGQRLRRLRTDRGYSLNDLAQRAGITPQAIHGVEKGKRKRFRVTTLELLARALDVSPAYLEHGYDPSGDEMPPIEAYARARGIEDDDLVRYLRESYDRLLELQEGRRRQETGQ